MKWSPPRKTRLLSSFAKRALASAISTEAASGSLRDTSRSPTSSKVILFESGRISRLEFPKDKGKLVDRSLSVAFRIASGPKRAPGV